MYWILKDNQHSTCVRPCVCVDDSRYGVDFFTLTCAGENVIFSDYTDAACTIPQSVRLPFAPSTSPICAILIAISPLRSLCQSVYTGLLI